MKMHMGNHLGSSRAIVLYNIVVGYTRDERNCPGEEGKPEPL